MTDDEFNHHWERRHTLLFTARVSVIYHRRRERFFDLLDKWTKASTVLAGSALLAAAIKDYLPQLSLLIAGLGLLSLVFGYGDRKQAHKEMANAFILLIADINKVGETEFTPEQLSGWSGSLEQLSAKEPPQLYALVTLCENEAKIALDRSASVIDVPWHQRSLANWISFGHAIAPSTRLKKNDTPRGWFTFVACVILFILVIGLICEFLPLASLIGTVRSSLPL
jgi:hypothetical protein